MLRGQQYIRQATKKVESRDFFESYFNETVLYTKQRVINEKRISVKYNPMYELSLISEAIPYMTNKNGPFWSITSLYKSCPSNILRPTSKITVTSGELLKP